MKLVLELSPAQANGYVKKMHVGVAPDEVAKVALTLAKSTDMKLNSLFDSTRRVVGVPHALRDLGPLELGGRAENVHSSSLVLVYPSVLHHKADVSQSRDVGQRIAGDPDDVRIHPRRDRSDSILQT